MLTQYQERVRTSGSRLQESPLSAKQQWRVINERIYKLNRREMQKHDRYLGEPGPEDENFPGSPRDSQSGGLARQDVPENLAQQVPQQHPTLNRSLSPLAGPSSHSRANTSTMTSEEQSNELNIIEQRLTNHLNQLRSSPQNEGLPTFDTLYYNPAAGEQPEGSIEAIENICELQMADMQKYKDLLVEVQGVWKDPSIPQANAQRIEAVYLQDLLEMCIRRDEFQAWVKGLLENVQIAAGLSPERKSQIEGNIVLRLPGQVN